MIIKPKPQNKNNPKERYNFAQLIGCHSQLDQHVFTNSYGNKTIDFANAKAVKALNTALLKLDYGVDYWEFPDANLCPPIPGRAAYMSKLNDLLNTSNLKENTTVLDIGTGATCIYPLLGIKLYGWQFIASEIDKAALSNAQTIIDKNELQNNITLRFQDNPQQILTGILKPSEKVTATICNPPFYKNEAEAKEHTRSKLKGLNKQSDAIGRNFSGTTKELCYPGGEKAFLHNYLYQSSLLKTNCFWFTSLVSKKEHVKSMHASLKKLGAVKIKVLEMALGNKKSRVVAWTFLTDEEQKKWSS